MTETIVTTENTPEAEIAPVPPVNAEDAPAPQDSPTSATSHTVIPGETWESIAESYGMTAEDLFDLNVGSNDHRTMQSISVGAVLSLVPSAE